MVKIVDAPEPTEIDRGPFDSDQLCGLETSAQRQSVSKDYSNKDSFSVTKNYKEMVYDKFAKGK
jgi:hypothetical protein